MLRYTCCLAFSVLDNHFGRSKFGSTMGAVAFRGNGLLAGVEFSRKLEI